MLKKDLLELCLLQLLAGGDKYGYEVLTPLRAAFPDTQESAIYALLRGLGKAKLTTWYMAPGGGGPDRKYYQLTSAGQARLAALQEDWRHMRDAIASFGVE
ncbi:PadR family transcriptional regulator [Flintibacter muris]|uniref:PadR family transcriptional regulator n=1 Tax=Flintibacter muris TaxID=2941327 RepID=UPI002041E484|nr:PadR family transcriptional regulator [Flintibacter muris]